MNTYYDTFTAANGTNLVGGHTSDSGATYAYLASQAQVNSVIQGNHPYSVTSGSYSWLVPNVTLGANDPVAITFTSQGAGTSGTLVGVGQRIQSNGNGYFAYLTTDGQAQLVVISGGNGTRTTSGTPNPYGPMIPAGTYQFVMTLTNTQIELYLIRQTDGYYFNTVNYTWQSAKAPLACFADLTTLAAGSPGLLLSIGQGDSNPAPFLVSSASGGPAILLPADLGCSLAADRVTTLTCLSAQGGQSPKTYQLQRKTGAGSYSTVGTMTPGTPYYDYTVAASTTYTYQVVCTDANSLTSTSAPVSATTTAPQTLRAYTPGTPASPYTVFSNGTVPNDTTGAPLQFYSARIYWDPLYQLYFAITDVITSSLGNGKQIYGYYSSDLLNWTPSPNNPLLNVNASSGAGSFPASGLSACARATLFQHPTDGNYYIGVKAKNTSTGTSAIYTFKSTTGPMGPFNYLAGPLLPAGASAQINDSHGYIDYDGSIWYYCANYNATNETVVQQFSSAMTGFSGSSAAQLQQMEGIAPYRMDRQMCVGGSNYTVWDWNPNFVQFIGSPIGAPAYFYSNSVTYPNTSLFTTAAEQIAAPAGAGPPLPYGYGGTNGQAPSGGYGHGGTAGGTATGIDPIASYASQVGHVTVTRTGQRIWTTDRYDDSGSSNSTLVWLPMSFDAHNQPTLPFVSSFTPSAQRAAVARSWCGASLLMGM